MRVVSQPTFHWSAGVIVLNSIADESGNSSRIKFYGDLDLYFSLRCKEQLPHIFVQFELICCSMPSFWSRNHQPAPNCILPAIEPSWKLPIIVASTSLSVGLRL